MNHTMIKLELVLHDSCFKHTSRYNLQITNNTFNLHMGFFFDSMNTTMDLPCLTLVETPRVVPLPGLSYKISFRRKSVEYALAHFKQNESFKNHYLLSRIDDDRSEEINIIDADVVKSCVECEKRFGDTGNEKTDNNVPIYIVLMPYEAPSYSIGTLCKITGIVVEENVIIITFKSLSRVETKQPLLNMKQKLWKAQFLILDDLNAVKKWDSNASSIFIGEFIKTFDELNKTIGTFKEKYRFVNKNPVDPTNRMLLLSPLSNMLFFQLNKSEFVRSWKLLKVYVEELKTHKNNLEICNELVSMMDLTLSIIPTTVSQKLEFLSIIEVKSRALRFSQYMKEFLELFEKLYESADYVNDYFSDASNAEKSKLIANQLKSLRFYIDDVKRSNAISTTGSNSQNDLTGVSSKSSKYLQSRQSDLDSAESEDDIEGIKKFLASLDEKLVHSDAIKLLKKDFKRLLKTNPQNADHQVLRNYFDVVMDIPFGKLINFTSIDLALSKKKLDEDHFGLDAVKRRLIQYLSVLKLTQDNIVSTENLESNTVSMHSKKSPILLLVGPPGVGKTSIAKSIAEVLGRKFQRISLGGIHNEAEIRGHRRTYVGSMCGLIVNALRRSGSMNPLILLDEIDKVLNAGAGGFGTRVSGDPGAALLEVLDPEQNSTFSDHFIGFPVDLSQVLFFCTANELDGISAPLLNRMELIEIPGYTPEEKIQIGSRYLLPKQIKANGLDLVRNLPELRLTSDAWDSVVMEYTRESGVRSLERELGSIVRGKILEYLETKKVDGIVTKKTLPKYLGLPHHSITDDIITPTMHSDKFGVVNGLSYNSDGTGSVLVFEMIKVSSESGNNGPFIKTTGNLGSILEESIEIATSFVKNILNRRLISNIDHEIFKEFVSSEYHLHVPMGAISKDGPSAGAAIALAILSSALKKTVPNKVCMTGEITLRGKILPIGGIKEKLLGAQMYKMEKVLIPYANRKELIQSVATDPDEQYALFQDSKDKELSIVENKTNLKVLYCLDFFDVIKNVWPDLEYHFSDTSRVSL